MVGLPVVLSVVGGDFMLVGLLDSGLCHRYQHQNHYKSVWKEKKANDSKKGLNQAEPSKTKQRGRQSIAIGE